MSQYPAGQPGPPGSDLPFLIQRSRGEVTDYLNRVRTRQRRLLTLAVVAGALATLFAATPAIGGKPLSDVLPVWQLLCAFAAICSLIAAIATQLQKSSNLEANVARAETVRARLDILNIGLIAGNLSREQAANEYGECLQLASFL
jgi:uncharacterized membrane protein YozB (DUF420 family)